MSPDTGKMLIIWCKAKKAGTKLYTDCADNAVVHCTHWNEIHEESRVTVMVIIVRHVIFKNLKILLTFSYDKCKWFSILGKATNMLSVEVNSKATLFPSASSNSPTRCYSPDTKDRIGECKSTSLRPLKSGAQRPRGSRPSAAGRGSSRIGHRQAQGSVHRFTSRYSFVHLQRTSMCPILFFYLWCLEHWKSPLMYVTVV